MGQKQCGGRQTASVIDPLVCASVLRGGGWEGVRAGGQARGNLGSGILLRGEGRKRLL